jgi:hypothetical protein
MSRFYGNFDPASTATTTVTTEVVDTSSVVLYLPFDEDIQDDSGVGTSMTAVGNAFVQSSLTQFGAKALYLDGSGDYVQSVPISTASSVFRLHSASFTIDGWLYPQTFNEVISNFNPSNPYSGFTASMNFHPHAAGKLAFFTSDGSAFDTSMASSTAFALNQWSHFAIVRGAISANSLEFFINGVKHGSHTVSRNPGTPNSNLRIGASNNSQPNRQFKGAMDDLRIIKGVALYSTNFSVPTTAVGNSITISSSAENTRTHSHVWNYSDVYDARSADSWPASSIFHPSSPSLVSLYIPGDTDLVDASVHGHTLIAQSGAAVSSAESAFGGASVYYNSSYTDVVVNTSPSTSTSLVFGTGDFTLEYFIKTTSTNINVMHPRNESNTGTGYWAHIIQDSKLRWNHRYDVANLWEVNASADLFDNAFHHVAIVRNSGAFKVFIDGVSKSASSGSFSDSSNYVYTSAFQIGGHGNLSGGGYMAGYIDDFRITKHAVYTTAFTVPTTALGIQTFL